MHPKSNDRCPSEKSRGRSRPTEVGVRPEAGAGALAVSKLEEARISISPGASGRTVLLPMS